MLDTFCNRLRSATYLPFANSVGEDQTAQNVQSDLILDLLCPLRTHPPPKKIRGQS